MRKYTRLLSVFTMMLLAGCSSSHILITSNKYHFPLDHSKIMTVVVIKDKFDSTKDTIEKHITTDLKTIGYNAVTASEEFGPGGLADLRQEETYLKLCRQGIDAVIIVTLIDKSKEKQFHTRKSYTYPDNYYYDRIWNYKNIQADFSQRDSFQGSYFREAILFNLSTLEAECTIQTPSFKSLKDDKALQFEKKLIKKMLKEKILKRQNKSGRKPF